MPRRKDPRSSNPFDPLDGPISDSFDLHGFTAAETREAVPPYLARARKQYPGGLVHIITGKGKGSIGRPILKGTVRRLLEAGHPAVRLFSIDPDGGGYLVRLTGGR